MAEEEQQGRTPHVIIFPFPLQGHINSMLKLAELFSFQHFHVTFLNTQHNRDRLSKSTVCDQLKLYFRTISDGLPADHPRGEASFLDLWVSLKENSKPLFRDLCDAQKIGPPVTCIIADGFMSFMIDVAQELRIPIISFRTISACSFWAYFCIPKLIEVGELPMKEGTNMDRLLNCIPGMEGLVRLRDLPSFFRAKDLTNPSLQAVLQETLNTTRASALILNTIEELEWPILEQIRKHCPIIYTVGPLHAHARYRNSNYSPLGSSSLWKEDDRCIQWLDHQAKKSVIYVSFGSLAVITRDEFLEFLYGLVNSKRPFLWVIRPDIVVGKEAEIPSEVLEETKERGLMVKWAPQEDVLAHPSVGGFLTHSGWNSTLESLIAGVPMICWPFFADQQINSRFVSHVWKVGLDMKDSCSRLVVEKLVGELMEGKREELEKAAGEMAEFASRSVGKGGSSHTNFERLISDIRSLNFEPPF